MTGTSATLEAQIKPVGPDTTYYFQYGAVSCSVSPGSCTDLPLAPGIDIGGGFNGQSVSVHLQGLQPDTAYHFRVVAINGLGASEGVDQIFTTQTTGNVFALPDGRAWELVSPPNKQGADIFALAAPGGPVALQAAEDGGAIAYVANNPVVANPAGDRSLESTQVISTRLAPGSWETQDS